VSCADGQIRPLRPGLALVGVLMMASVGISSPDELEAIPEPR
jgi:hypothetical protein